MNVELKQRLLKDAGFHFRPSIENTVSGIDWSSASYGYDQCVDKLIALVVQDCVRIVERHGSLIGIDYIKEHFGVK